MNARALATRLIRSDFARLLGGSSYIYALRITGAAITFATQILLARWMGAAELGAYVFAFSASMVLGFTATLGFPAAAQIFIPQSLVKGRPDLAQGFAIRSRQIVLISSCVVGALLSAGAALYYWPDLWRAAPLMLSGLATPVIAILLLNESVCRSIDLIALAILPNMIVRQVIHLALIAGLVLAGYALSAPLVMGILVAITAASALGQTMILRGPLNRATGGAAPSFETETWMRTSLPLLMMMAYSGYQMEVNIVIAGLYLGDEQRAIYNAAWRIANIAGFFFIAVGFQIGPEVSRLVGAGNKQALQRLIARATLIRFLYALGVVAAVWILGHYVLSLFGPVFLAGESPLSILVLTQLIMGAFGPTSHILAVTGHQNHSAVIFSVATAVMIVLTAVLTPLIGMEGSALAVIATTVGWNAYMYWLVVRDVGIHPTILSVRHALPTAKITHGGTHGNAAD